MQKKTKSIIVSAVIVILLATGLFAVKSVYSADTAKGQKNITVTVNDGENSKVLKIKTEREYLGDALFDNGLVTEAEYKTGFYTVIDGKKADFDADGAWWCIKRNGEDLMTGANETPIKDGERYEAIYTAG